MELKCGAKQNVIPWICDAHYGMISSIEFMVGRLNVPIYITNSLSDCAIYPIDIWAIDTARFLLCHLT
jgi:hypothetical protein